MTNLEHSQILDTEAPAQESTDEHQQQFIHMSHAMVSAALDQGELILGPSLIPANTILELAGNPNLTNRFSYIANGEAQVSKRHVEEGESTVEMSESEGIDGLVNFLQGFISSANNDPKDDDSDLIDQANDILENLGYISEEEIDNASESIAQSWAEYLDANPDRKIYMWSKGYKSSGYVLDKILAHVDLEKYEDRLRFFDDAFEDLKNNNPPSNSNDYKIVMVDDWLATGRQLSISYGEDIEYSLAPYTKASDEDLASHTEIQLIAATRNQVSDGLTTNSMSHGVHLPIKAVYEIKENSQGKPLVTGVHSSTDDFFEIPIGKMVESLKNNHNQQDVVMPPLTNIVRSYDGTNIPENISRLIELQGRTPNDGYRYF